VTPWEEARDLARRVRQAYDRLGDGPRAILRRCRTANEVLEEGWFWPLIREADARGDKWWLARMVACFPAAAHQEDDDFDLGAHLRRRIYSEMGWNDLPRRAVAFRRLLAARDGDDLAHHLRRLLQRASQPRDARASVDWGVVGAGMKLFGDGVRRRWASGFYTGSEGPSADLDSREGVVA